MEKPIISRRARFFLAAKKLAVVFLLFSTIAFLLAAPSHQAQAQIPVTDAIANAWSMGNTFWQRMKLVLKELWQKAGSLAFQRTLSSALNKIAYDTANYIGSGGEGQQPLFVTKDWGQYLAQIGDEAAGEFLENFTTNLNKPYSADCQKKLDECNEACAKMYEECISQNDGATCMTSLCHNACRDSALECEKTSNPTASNSALYTYSPSFNVCQPSSIEAKLKISLGLAEQSRPQGPNCTASDMVRNWGDAYEKKLADWQNPNFIDTFVNIFDPRSNDLGIYLMARTDLSSKAVVDTKNTENSLISLQGWIEERDIAGNLISTPNKAKTSLEAAEAQQSANFGKVTGDILVDTANVFLNQLFVSAFDNLTKRLAQKTGELSSGGSSDSGYESDPSVVYGEASVKEVTSKLIKPNFTVRTDYNILSDLAICLDPRNPGPTNCVIDDQFMQGISEKKTVAEALESGYLHGSWQMTADTRDNSYSLRNISILRKYRILPVGWEEAASRASSLNKQATLSDLVACFSQDDQYNQFSANFNVNDQAWCTGLVDPNWVLKAPLNYCKKEGIGAQVLNQSIIPGTPAMAGYDRTLSTLSLTRAEEYCADEQSCIKEKADGSCDTYGYCLDEKRIWNFGQDSCQAINNTCQTFTGAGKTVSYLENTLDYSGCDANSAGCRQYSLNGAYDIDSGIVSWNQSPSAYFNRNLAKCDSGAEGCTELLRVKPAWGANLVMNSDFGSDNVGDTDSGWDLFNDYWPYWSSPNTNNSSRRLTIVESSEEPGGNSGKALKLEVVGQSGEEIALGLFSSNDHPLLPDNFQIMPGQAYTVSADVLLAEGEKLHLVAGGDYQVYKQIQDKNSWIHMSVTRQPSQVSSDADFSVTAYGLEGEIVFYVKNLKFEITGWDTGYNYYGAFKTYEKLLPPYLETACYVDATSATKDYRLKDDAPQVCRDFVRYCNRDEVGCELYTNIEDGFEVPAQVANSDYCPGECLGYDVYVSRLTNFNSPQAENLIPDTAKSCSVQAAGCNEFTNLDKLAQGGEAREYYTYLKQCVKPSQATCSSYYSWEGTGTGYQLKAYSLKQSQSGSPAVTSDDSELCNAEIYNLPISDPEYNSDCREFYDVDGHVFYHLLERTITCSDNCHPYRLSENNFDAALDEDECSGPDKHWDGNANGCVVCLNGGLWSDEHGACLYQAVPEEGRTCQAAEVGCREYNGNNGNNVVRLFSYNFESGLSGWFSNCVNGVSISTIANSQDGHSLFYNDNTVATCAAVGDDGGGNAVSRRSLIEKLLAAGQTAAQLKVGRLKSGSAYTIKFLARSANDANLSIYFLNTDTGEEDSFQPLKVYGGNQWGVYQTNLENLSQGIGDNQLLIIRADEDFYFDDIVLTEISDRYYLIKGSSQIPDICSYDMFDNYQGPDYNLGCSQYLDRSNTKHNLRQFSRVCSEDSVGCEQMIATGNYSSYQPGIWGDENDNGQCDSGETDCLSVPGDRAVYAVYDPEKVCNSADLGCSRLGQASGSGNNTVWSDLYRENNPNQYEQILCGLSSVGCEAWQDKAGGLNYFRDPGDNACSYRASQDPTVPGKTWYKIPVKRCDTNANGEIDSSEAAGPVCGKDSDCGAGATCIVDNNDYPCSVSYFKTFGLGGQGAQVAVPDSSAGLCEAKESGCSEYIDPVSRFIPNLVSNPNYQTNANGDIEGWENGIQDIALEANKLYIFGTDSSSGNNVGEVRLKLKINGGLKPLLLDNTLGTTTNAFTIPTGPNQKIIFYNLSANTAELSGGASGKTITVKPAAIEYQLENNVDKKSCNGLVNFDNGCVLFNERSIVGSQGYSSLSGGWDAYATEDGQAPVVCSSSQTGSCTANTLLKVRPDRVCGRWLDCITYVDDPETGERTCYAVGECDRLDDKGECANFVASASGTNIFDPVDKNAVGYTILNKYQVANMQEVGFNSDVHYDFEESVPTLSCIRADGGQCSFVKNIAADILVREPQDAPTDYPAHGKNYLKINSAYLISPQAAGGKVGLLKGKEYFINYLINTKDSGLGAKMILRFFSSATAPAPSSVVVFEDSANQGWKRVVHSFVATSSAPFVQIQAGADEPKESGYVYFDDINIEPVLYLGEDELGNDEYATRECRLYPASDSLTCSSKNDNVVSDGLEGYCLEHDPNNPGVCLLWYPTDWISASANSRSALGYQGKFPLNYCTELDGNFNVVEKRIMNKFWDGHEGQDPIPDSQQQNCNQFAAYGIQTIGDCNCAFIPNSDFCPSPQYITFDAEQDTSNGALHRAYCVPNAALLTVKTQKTYSAGENSNCQITYYEGWGTYNGLDYKPYSQNCYDTTPAIDCVALDESKNATPPIKIFNYHSPATDEDDLLNAYGQDNESNFNLACSSFVQVVGNNGENKAWVDRVGPNSIFPTSTPTYFTDNSNNPYSASPYSISRYGRNREDVPFGAAVWPEDFNLLSSQAISFRDQYSEKKNEDVFAGRPFSCDRSLSGSDACSRIGYCSLNPNVFCLAEVETQVNAAASGTKFILGSKTCSEGGYGTCVPLWKPAFLGQFNPYDSTNILRNLFLKSYSSFSYNYDAQGYVADGNFYGDYSIPFTGNPFDDECNDPNLRGNNNLTSFCAIWPKVESLRLSFNGQPISGPPYNIQYKGVYKLEFNTIVDKEQQPLKEIRIDWGDGSVQVITGQDHHPSASNPHVLYHYYKQAYSNVAINVNVYDNWGFYSSCIETANGNGVCFPPID